MDTIKVYGYLLIESMTGAVLFIVLQSSTVNVKGLDFI